MARRDRRIDACIAKAAPFARPILEQAIAWMAEGGERHWKHRKK